MENKMKYYNYKFVGACVASVAVAMISCRGNRTTEKKSDPPKEIPELGFERPVNPGPDSETRKYGRVIGVVDGIEQLEFDAARKVTMRVDYGAPLMVSSQSGAKYILKVNKNGDSSETYEWQSISDSGKRGTGKLYESYRGFPSSQRMIEIEKLRLAYDSSGTFSYHIQFMPEELTISGE
jgi:hypothetical protein